MPLLGWTSTSDQDWPVTRRSVTNRLYHHQPHDDDGDDAEDNPAHALRLLLCGAGARGGTLPAPARLARGYSPARGRQPHGALTHSLAFKCLCLSKWIIYWNLRHVIKLTNIPPRRTPALSPCPPRMINRRPSAEGLSVASNARPPRVAATGRADFDPILHHCHRLHGSGLAVGHRGRSRPRGAAGEPRGITGSNTSWHHRAAERAHLPVTEHRRLDVVHRRHAEGRQSHGHAPGRMSRAPALEYRAPGRAARSSPIPSPIGSPSSPAWSRPPCSVALPSRTRPS